MTKKYWLWVAAATLAMGGTALTAQRLALRRAGDDVRSADVRDSAGLAPNENLLFNGWGVTPAGEHVALSDMPLKMVVSPDGQTLAAVNGGFSSTGLTLIS